MNDKITPDQSPQQLEPAVQRSKNTSTLYKKIAILLFSIIAIGILIGTIAIPVIILLNMRATNQRFDKVESLLRTSHPELASLEPQNITLSKDAPFLGQSNAPVTIVEFADFQCPFCKQFQDTIFPSLKRKYTDTSKAKFYFQDFPFLGDESQQAAEAAKCSGDQNKFWEYHDLLYANQKAENSGTFSTDNLKKFAVNLNLDTAKFNTCVDGHVYKTDVETQTQAGQQYGVSATPTVFVNGKRFEGVGQIADYEKTIDEILKK